MKLFIAAVTLLALASPVYAETETCTGRVKINVVTDNEGLNPKGTKEFSVGGCVFEGSARQKRVLRTCPLGSHCRVEGTPDGDATIETIVSVTRVDPYKEGMRDYRRGQCFRARPYIDDSEMSKLWIKGYHAHPTKKLDKHSDEICFPGRDR